MFCFFVEDAQVGDSISFAMFVNFALSKNKLEDADSSTQINKKDAKWFVGIYQIYIDLRSFVLSNLKV